jgi:hypothetical protein
LHIKFGILVLVNYWFLRSVGNFERVTQTQPQAQLRVPKYKFAEYYSIDVCSYKIHQICIISGLYINNFEYEISITLTKLVTYFVLIRNGGLETRHQMHFLSRSLKSVIERKSAVPFPLIYKIFQYIYIHTTHALSLKV